MLAYGLAVTAASALGQSMDGLDRTVLRFASQRT